MGLGPLLLLFLAQAPPADDARVVFRAQLVSEEGGRPIAHAHASPPTGSRGIRDAWSDDEGRVVMVADENPSGRSVQPFSRPARADEIDVGAEGRTAIVIDRLGSAPWASVVPMRAAMTLCGTVEGVRNGESIAVIVPAHAVTWPPRTGLVRADVRLSATIADGGRFCVAGIPAHTAVEVRMGAYGHELGALLEPSLVMSADSAQRSFVRSVDEASPTQRPSEGWRRVAFNGFREDGRPNIASMWGAVSPGGRLCDHNRVAGGRSHVHENRACNHLEAQPGRRVVVVGDASGRVGIAPVDIPADHDPDPVRVDLAPGALVRFDATRLPHAGRLTLSRDGTSYFESRIVPGEIRYELVPAGGGHVAVDFEGSDAKGLRRDFTAKAGEIVRIPF